MRWAFLLTSCRVQTEASSRWFEGLYLLEPAHEPKIETRTSALVVHTTPCCAAANVSSPPFSRCRGGETKDFAFAANGSKVRTPAFGASRSERRLSPHASFILKARMTAEAENPTKHGESAASRNMLLPSCKVCGYYIHITSQGFARESCR